MWTKAVDIYCVKEIRTRTDIFLGLGAMNRLDEFLETLKANGVKKLLVVAGKHSFSCSGAEKSVKDALQRSGLEWKIFSAASDKNGNIPFIRQAVEEGRTFGAEAVIAAGGGRIIDAGKCTALLLAQKEKRDAEELLQESFIPEKTLPLIVLNLSHGSGSENNPYAMIRCPEKNITHLVRQELFYPWKVICDPAFTVSLPLQETRYAAMDAVSQALESSVGKRANPLSIFLAHEIVKLAANYLPQVEKDPKNLTGRYFLLFASLLAGLAADNGEGQFSHVLVHPLCALKNNLPHGLGVSILMPSLIKKVYPAYGKTLAAVLAPVVPDLSGNAEEVEDAAAGLEVWISGCGVKLEYKDALFLKENIDELVETSYQNPALSQLLCISPLEASKDAIRSIFDDALTPCGTACGEKEGEYGERGESPL